MIWLCGVGAPHMRILWEYGELGLQGANLHGRSPGNLEMGFLLLAGLDDAHKVSKTAILEVTRTRTWCHCVTLALVYDDS